MKVENFAKEPGWEGRNNDVISVQKTVVVQSFGYSATHFAGRGEGEMGGQIQRSSQPASYSDTIDLRTLDDRLSASGTFAVTDSAAEGGLFIGYFNARQPGATERPIASLGIQLDFNQKGGKFAARLVTSGNKTCGVAIASGAAEAPIRNDGTRYEWKLLYDPLANQGDGRIQLMVKNSGAKRQSFEGDTFSADLPAGFRKEGAKFDRFGLMNLLMPGGMATVYCDDLQYDGMAEDFSIDPNWINEGNRGVFEDHQQKGAQDFGYSPVTNRAGGIPGELGGTFWRTDSSWAQYADRIEPVNLQQPLDAAGKVTLASAAPESEVYLGWFSSTDVDRPPAQGNNFLGIRIGGSAKTGHCFMPSYVTAKGTTSRMEKAPVMFPGQSYSWSIAYDPTAHKGLGGIRATLGEASIDLPLKVGHQNEGAHLDRFGLFTGYPAGGSLRVYLDDLSYSVGSMKAATNGGLGRN